MFMPIRPLLSFHTTRKTRPLPSIVFMNANQVCSKSGLKLKTSKWITEP